jgi:PAS domain S-box-containing protein
MTYRSGYLPILQWEETDPSSDPTPIPVEKQHYNLLRRMIEGLTDPIFVKDAEGRYILMNRAGADIVGRKERVLVGRTDDEIYPPDTAQHVATTDRIVLDSGEPWTAEETVRIRGGGTRRFLTTKFAYRDHKGRTLGIIGIARDLTSLRETEQRLSLIVDSAMDAVIAVDQEGIVRLFNSAAEEVFGAKSDTIMGRSFVRFCTPGLSRLLTDSWVAFERSGTTGRYLWAPDGLSARRASGEEFPVEATVSHSEWQGCKQLTLILRDVNERQRAEAEIRRLHLENEYLREEAEQELAFGDIVGRSEAIRKVLESVEQVAATDSTVLLLGETGTGKELIARAIHARSARRQHPLVKVNCAALPASLIESELFGHEKGAFTGALSRRIGRFEMADHGSLLLDEIGDLPVELQAKLLRVLQEGEFERVGGTRTLRTNVRIIAATNQDLEAAVRNSEFRADLFYRLNVFPIRLPPLRACRDDIPLLARHFAMRIGSRLGKPIDTIPAPTLEALVAYLWPGNVRELQNVVERGVILARDSTLDPGDWIPKALPDGDGEGNGTSLVEMQRRHIVATLEQTGWKVSGPNGAAELLGLKPTTLEARMKKLGIERP